MSLDDICDLPVAGIAAADSLLYLWATVAELPGALRVMHAWGFEYKSHAVWVKPSIGIGFWFRSQHELLLWVHAAQCRHQSKHSGIHPYSSHRLALTPKSPRSLETGSIPLMEISPVSNCLLGEDRTVGMCGVIKVQLEKQHFKRIAGRFSPLPRRQQKNSQSRRLSRLPRSVPS